MRHVSTRLHRGSPDDAAGVGLPERGLPGIRDPLAEARELFLASEQVDRRVVRGQILESWWRSRECRVAADRLDLSYLGVPDLDTPLGRAAEPVLRHLHEYLDGQPISIILADATGLVLRRLTGDRDLERTLDAVMLVPGFSYTENVVGTNAIGTALESGRQTHVFGHEHYAEQLLGLACAGVPLRDPVSGTILGVIALTCWRRDADPLLLTLVKSTANQLGRALTEASKDQELRLLREYARAWQHVGGLAHATWVDPAAVPRNDVSGGRGIQVGDGNVQHNYWLVTVPGASLDPKLLAVLRPDVAAEQVRRMLPFDVVDLFTTASPGDVRDVLRVLLANDAADRELVMAILNRIKDSVRDPLVEPLLGEFPGLQSEPKRTAVACGPAVIHPAGLLQESANDAVIVAGRFGWPEYGEIGAYICWPGQGFWENVTHLGFYADGEIKPVIPRVLAWHREVLLTSAEAAARRAAGEPELAAAIAYFLEQGTRDEAERYGIALLSPPGDPGTVHLRAPIVNDLVARSGKPTGWTQRFRYASLARLNSGVARTSEI
jgi:hypothetical protein